MDITIETLSHYHDRKTFDCGILELNIFFSRYAHQNQKNNINKTFVAVCDDPNDEREKKQILGFYTLSSGQIDSISLPPTIKHPKYPISVVRLARLAVTKKHQKNGVGGFLLYDALEKIKSAAELIGIFAVIVDAKDAQAISFYKHYGFIEFQDSTLFLPLKTIKQL